MVITYTRHYSRSVSYSQQFSAVFERQLSVFLIEAHVSIS